HIYRWRVLAQAKNITEWRDLPALIFMHHDAADAPAKDLAGQTELQPEHSQMIPFNMGSDNICMHKNIS
ncbi:MAG: hypothetical protein RLZZ137_1255, partial [Cyanobacteriota bacterium]